MATECTIKSNTAACNCTYEPCSRKGKCCACIRYHMRMDELPACHFPAEVERTYDRSVDRFIALRRKGR